MALGCTLACSAGPLQVLGAGEPDYVVYGLVPAAGSLAGTLGMTVLLAEAGGLLALWLVCFIVCLSVALGFGLWALLGFRVWCAVCWVSIVGDGLATSTGIGKFTIVETSAMKALIRCEALFLRYHPSNLHSRLPAGECSQAPLHQQR